VSTAIGEHAARIRAPDDHWLEAAAQRDRDDMPAIYAAAARELLPDTPALVGRDAIRAFSARLLDQLPRFARSVTAEEISIGEAGDLAVVRGCYRFTPDTQLPAQVQTRKFVGVWHRRDGD
jgi:ketosteroid isomerase-like protein